MTNKRALNGWRSGPAVAVALLLGTLAATPARAQNYQVLHDFASAEGTLPYDQVIIDSSGNLYGTTVNGGASGLYGTVFKLDASNGYAVTVLHDFTGADGANSQSALIVDSSGNFYGTTYSGGSSGTGCGGSGCGTVFKLDTSNVLTTLHNFMGSDGSKPYAALIADSSGNLYGTTVYGGASDSGTVFKLDASNGYALTTLHSFTGSDGSGPYAPLISDSSGNLYGTTWLGGAFSCGGFGCGTVFKLDTSNVLTTLHSFNGSDGSEPLAALLADSSGNFYGTTHGGGSSGTGCGGFGCGTVFKLDASNVLTTLHNFTGSPEGGLTCAAVIADSSGSLYGTTETGGGSACGGPGCGTVFKLDASNGYALTTLHAFTDTDGADPYAGLIADSAGNFYGTTQDGGASNFGVVFRVALCTPPTAAASGTAAICAGSSTPLTGSGGVSCFWSPATGLNNPNSCTPTASPAATTTYTLTVTDATGCVSTNAPTVTVTVNPLPVAAASGSATICAGSSTPLTGSGGVSCSWAPVTGLSNPNSCNPSASPASTTTYTLTVTDANGCVSTNAPTATVTVNPAPPAPTITAPGWAVVGATAIVATVPNNAGSTYAWTLSGGTITAGQGSSSIMFDAGPPGTTIGLSVVETPSVGCPTAAGTANVQVDFLDVSPSHPFHDFVDTIARNSITAGCGSGNYCPDNPVTRAQMAVFLLRGEHGSAYAPPTCTPPGVFGDVPCPAGFAVDWVERLSIEGITAGCGGGNYCPDSPVTRAQMAVFLLRAEHGSSYTPPACLGIFSDVSCPGGFAVDWIEQLYTEGVTGGCSVSPLLYCPDNPNTRGQMATFLVVTFNLQ